MYSQGYNTAYHTVGNFKLLGRYKNFRKKRFKKSQKPLYAAQGYNHSPAIKRQICLQGITRPGYGWGLVRLCASKHCH